MNQNVNNPNSVLVIPDGVTEIQEDTIPNKERVEEIVVPGSIQYLRGSYLRSCPNLKRVVIQEGVREIGYELFPDCKSLKEVVIPESVTIIKEGAFESCGIERLVWPQSVPVMPERVLCNCKLLKHVEIPYGVKSIGKMAFSLCENLKELTIPDSVTDIEESAFSCSGLESFVWPKSVTVMCSGMFECCRNLTRLEMPDTLTRFIYYPLMGTNISQWKIPMGVESFIETGILGDPSTVYGTITVVNDRFDFDKMNRYCDANHVPNYYHTEHVYLWNGNVSKVKRVEMRKKLLDDFCKGLEMGFEYSEETKVRNRELIKGRYANTSSGKWLLNLFPMVAASIILVLLTLLQLVLVLVTFPYVWLRGLGKAFSNASNTDIYFEGTIRSLWKRIESYWFSMKGEAEELPFANPAVIRYLMKEKMLTQQQVAACLAQIKDEALRKELEQYQPING